MESANIRSELIELKRNPSRIRNVCILAHVDHGKTTLADSLLGSNGLVSEAMVGRLRYMDTREDEQIRGITMKSSAVSLLHRKAADKESFIVNLIDSPGHVDFSSEVSTAVRICDGSVLVIDVVEGVCAQTVAVVRQAIQEKHRMVLVLNKIDRLIVELKLSPLQAYEHINRVLESVNSLIARLLSADFTSNESSPQDQNENSEYFNPVNANVIFASSIDGWGFAVEHFVELCAQKLNCNRATLRKCVWGNYYLDMKKHKIKPNAKENSKSPLACTVVFSNVWAIYNGIIENDRALIEKICKQSHIRLNEKLMEHKDVHVPIRHIMHQWLPLDKFVLDAIVTTIESPAQLAMSKITGSLMSSVHKFDKLSPKTQSLSQCFQKCDSQSPYTIAYVSKFVAVDRNDVEFAETTFINSDGIEQKYVARVVETGGVKDVVFLGFARVYSGRVKRGQELKLIWPRHNPRGNHLFSEVIISDLYLMMGRDYVAIDEALSGNVFAFSVDKKFVLAKSAVLTNTIDCSPFCVKTSHFVDSSACSLDEFASVPLMQVAVEALNPTDLVKLREGVQLLNQSDPGLEIKLKSSGEILLCTWGEVHLQRCLKDLKDVFAGVDFNVSKPVVPFRETIVEVKDRSELANIRKRVKNQIEKRVGFVVRVAPIPVEALRVMEHYCSLITELSAKESTATLAECEKLKSELNRIFSDSVDYRTSPSVSVRMGGSVDRIVSFGARHAGTMNLLLYNDSQDRSFFDQKGFVGSIWRRSGSDSLDDDRRSTLDTIIDGFHLAMIHGPLCEEEIYGCCVFIEQMLVRENAEIDGGSDVSVDEDGTGVFQATRLMQVKRACSNAVSEWPQKRLMLAMYRCDIQCDPENLGRLNSVVKKHRGQVVEEDLISAQMFLISITLPVAESFGFVVNAWIKTSGAAMPQLLFSHWELLEGNPLIGVEDEMKDEDDATEEDTRAREYMNSIRARKGLRIREVSVKFAEKQRTLGRNK